MKFVSALIVILIVSMVSVTQAGIEIVPKEQKISEIIPIPDKIATNITVDVACDCRKIRIRDLNHIAPCSVPTDIVVCDPYSCGEITLTVCMPQLLCGQEIKPVVSRKGRKVRYNYGKYRIEIYLNRREILIDYDN